MRSLAVEDCDSDFYLLQLALQECSHAITAHHADNGENAVGDLRLAQDGKAARPDLVLLDVNLPRMNRSEALKFMKGNANFRDIPVHMFTSSNHPGERQRAMSNGADGFTSKPSDYTQLLQIVHKSA